MDPSLLTNNPIFCLVLENWGTTLSFLSILIIHHIATRKKSHPEDETFPKRIMTELDALQS
jgi:hypothetical protein